MSMRIWFPKKTVMITLVQLGFSLGMVLMPVLASAATPVSPGGLPRSSPDSDSIRTILSIVFGILGSFALLGITLSGIKYITSSGDSQKTSEAKNGIVYSLVGLVVAISAEAMVAFLVKRT